MLDAELLEILVCPESKQPLREATPEEIDAVMSAASGGKMTRGGTSIAPMEGALIREDGKLLYPVRDGIPIMLLDEAVDLSN